MRLLDAKIHQLVTCDDNQPPSYAILSHTWGAPDEEVSFQDMQVAAAEFHADTSPRNWEKKPGWAKIQRACLQALEYGYQYLWVDTCCIDKSSSAELQEGINSMFRWYESASICLAYLSDIASNCDPEAPDSAFRKARWFSRGWTLQELLAPQIVIFFDSDWNYLGDKNSLSGIIEEISGIEARYIGLDLYASQSFGGSAYERLSEASIAQRMSWMSGRQTTRKEDMAYCLLGIFDIHIPMLYGEGKKAFTRLQEEIMKASDDTTLLSWGYKFPGDEYFEADSILAPNPASFRHCHDLVPSELVHFPRPSFSMTQRGLVCTMPVRRDQNHDQIVYAILACGQSQWMLVPGRCQNLLAIPLISVSACDSPGLWKEQDEYLRYSWCTPMLVSTEFLKGAETRSVVIRRPSRLTERLKYLPGILKPLRGANLIGMYPPQPVDMFLGSQFASFSTSLFLDSHMELHRSGRSGPNFIAIEDGSEIRWNERKGIQMFLIDASAGRLVVIVEYKIEIYEKGSELLDVTTCRVYDMPSREFDLECLHSLGLGEKSLGLREVSSLIRDEKTMFKIKDDDVFLSVRIRKSADSDMKKMTNIEIFTERE